MKKFNLLLASALIYASMTANVSAQEAHTYGPIKPGEMLWTIAGKVSPSSSVDRHQVILALHRANPQAFSISCNLNSLKIGSTLVVPTLAEMQALTRNQAIKELNRQAEEWQNRRQKQIICPPIAPQPVAPAKPSTTETTADAKPLTPEPTVPPTTTATGQNNTQTVGLVPDQKADDNTQNSKAASATSSSTMIAMLIGGLLAIVLVGGLLYKRAKNKAKENEALMNSPFSQPTEHDPIDEMPLPGNQAEKQSTTEEKSLSEEKSAKK
jgi:FimV-like protein